MGKNSGKGRRARWRRIDTSEVEDAAALRSAVERQGKDVEVLPDAKLFFIDKAQAVPEKTKTRKQAAKEKVLRSKAMGDASHVRPVVWAPVPRKRKAIAQKEARLAKAAANGNDGLVDPWGTEGDSVKPENFEDEAQAIAAKLRTAFGYVRPAKRRKADAPKHIPIVEVDAPGCSYNPDKDHHEEVVAAAVAEEMQKGLDVEMRAKGPPKHVSWQPEVDPLLQLQEDAWVEEDTEDDAEADEASDGHIISARAKGKKTAADRNRASRAKDQNTAVEAKHKLKQQRRDLQNVKQLEQELADMDAEKEHRRQRRQAIKAQKALTQPPRLGKLKYEKAPVQVLLSSEVTGSLRKLKAAPMLAKDRVSVEKGFVRDMKS
ncbi:g3419 [Coccomyxa viridis]|uniref:Ribosome biogenesis protein NOP53 n=1 Tax=Coccomyxa viridis TaxID=1274662 RepID=A0ABP1FMR4_9CHLO